MKINKKIVTTSLLLAFCSGFSATASASFFSSIENMFYHKNKKPVARTKLFKGPMFYHKKPVGRLVRLGKATKGVVAIDNATVHKFPVPVTTKSPVSKITP